MDYLHEKPIVVKSKRKGVKQKIGIITIASFVFYLVYSRIFPETNIGIGNVVLFTISVFAMAYGIIDILYKGVKINNIFLTCYFFFLAINNLNISGLQKNKDLVDIYYLLAGAIVFWGIVRVFDNQKVKTYVTGSLHVSPNTIGFCLIVLALVLKAIIIMQTGVRLFDANWSGGGTGNQYTVGGITGLYQICIWSLLLLLPRLNRRNKIITVVMSILFEAVLAISRNNAMMIFTYLIIVFAISKKDKLLINKKITRRIIIVVALVIVGFVLFGNYRQTMRGWQNPGKVIENLLQSHFSNGMINWLYGYTAINYDVLLQTMASASHPFSFFSVFSPYIRLFGGYSALAGYQDAVYHINALNGFNASTIFGPMVYELGELYIIQVFILAIQVGVFGYIARKQRAEGHYAYLTAFGALAVFGNFYSIAIYCYVSIASMIIYLFIPLREEEE